VFVLLAVISCSREAEQASIANSEAALIAAQALFETGQLEAALARLDATEPRHTDLRGQIEQELGRRAMIEKFNTWSVGPAKLTRSLKRIAQICERRGGTWRTVNERMSACEEGEKTAIVVTREGSIVLLWGFYTSEYIETRNPGLYENEVRLLREAFGEPDTDDGVGRWLMPDDRIASIARSDEGAVTLMIGLASELSNVGSALTTVQEPVGGRADEPSTDGHRDRALRIPVSTSSRIACSDGDGSTGQPKKDTLHWIVSSDGTIRAQLESQREGEATRDFYVEGRAQGRSAILKGTNVAYIFDNRQVWHFELIASLTPQGDFESGRLVQVIEGCDCNLTLRIAAN
jgi:hypothetical protein